MLPVASTGPAHGSCSPILDGGKEGRGGGREGGVRGRAGPEGLEAPPVLSLHPFPACWQLSCSCHYTQGLQVFQSSAVSLSNSIFLPDKRGAGSAFPFTATGWMSAAVASALVRKIRKEVKEATALKLQAGVSENPGLASSEKVLSVPRRHGGWWWRGVGMGWEGRRS